jgi:hypothetical protein
MHGLPLKVCSLAPSRRMVTLEVTGDALMAYDALANHLRSWMLDKGIDIM